MGGFCCCAPGVCTPFSDSFGRADSTNLGPDWEEVGGDHWSIDNTELYNFSGLGIALVTTQPNTTPVYGFYVSVQTIDESAGDKWRIVMNYDPVTGYYHYAEFSRNSATSCSLSVGYRGATGDVVVDSYSTGDFVLGTAPCPVPPLEDTVTTRKLGVCLSARGIYAVTSSMLPFPYYYSAWGPKAAAVNPNLPRVGLTSGSGQTVRFDDFDAEWDTTDLTVCSACSCHCGSSYVSNAHTLLMTIVGAAGTCASLNGTEFILRRTLGCQWEGRVELGQIIQCVKFWITDGLATIDANNFFCVTDHSGIPGSCNPMNYTWDNAGLTINFCCNDPGINGSYSWQVTEAP